MTKIGIKVKVNGVERAAEVESRLLLVHFLRENLPAHRHARRLRHEPLRRLHGRVGRQGHQVLFVFAAQATGARY